MKDPLGLTPKQRRAAEERLVARYEERLLRTMELPPDRRSGPRKYDPVWPLEDGRIRTTEAFQGIFVEDVRIERAKLCIDFDDATAKQAAYRAGYGDLSAFRRAFKRATGLTVRAYAQRDRVGSDTP